MKRGVLNAVMAFWFASMAVAAWSDEVPSNPMLGERLSAINVLLIGNSQCPLIINHRMLEKLAESDRGARPIKVVGHVKGGASLKRHWEAGTGLEAARGTIAGATWDYVVLQEAWDAEEADMRPYAKLFQELIQTKRSETVLFGTASILRDYPQGFERLHRVHVTIGKELGVPVVDASYAYLKYFGANPSQERIASLFATDKAHPGLWGSYLYACLIYSTLTDRSPVGLAAPNGTPADVAKSLQEIAWTQHRETTTTLKPAGLRGPDPGRVSPAEYKVVELRNQKATMRDGVQLACDVFRPDGDGRFPAILCQTPYGKETVAVRARWFAQRGYVVINSDVRGRFASEGEWDPFSPLHKSDGYDLVEWVAKQPWCTGRVGAYGGSYLGWTQWWTATQAPPSLKCIVPEVAPPDQFFNGPYQNGVLAGWAMDWAAVMGKRTMNIVGKGAYGGFADTRDVDFRRLPYVDLAKHRGIGEAKWFETWIRQNTADGEYWRSIAYQTPENSARVTAPSLGISGWFDANFPGTPTNYLAMKQHGGSPEARRPRMVIGPWNHQFNLSPKVDYVDFGVNSVIDWNGYVCRWFDYYLKQIENGLPQDPPVHLFIMGRNEWWSASDWPLPETKWTKYYLHSAGKANGSGGDGKLDLRVPGEEPPDRYTYDPADPMPSPHFVNGHIAGPRDVRRAETRADVLIYTTPVLEEELIVAGPITAKLFAATSARDTDWMIRLIDVHPDGTAAFLCEGLIRARHRDPQRDGAFNPHRLSAIEPDAPYPYVIEFWRATGNAFAKGHRIRVEISSSFFPYYLRNLNTGADNIGLETNSVIAQQSVFHDRDRASHLVLPIVEARSREKQSSRER